MPGPVEKIFEQQNLVIAGGVTLGIFVLLNVAANQKKWVQGVAAFGIALGVVAAAKAYA